MLTASANRVPFGPAFVFLVASPEPSKARAEHRRNGPCLHQPQLPKRSAREHRLDRLIHVLCSLNRVRQTRCGNFPHNHAPLRCSRKMAAWGIAESVYLSAECASGYRHVDSQVLNPRYLMPPAENNPQPDPQPVMIELHLHWKCPNCQSVNTLPLPEELPKFVTCTQCKQISRTLVNE